MSQPYNPYAAPQAAPLAQQGLVAAGQPLPWQPGEVLELAWSRFKQNWFILVCAFLINIVIGQVASAAAGGLVRLASPDSGAIAVQSVSSLASMVVGAFLGVGFLRITLDAARGKPTQLGTLFMGGDRFLPMFGLQILMTIIVVVGTVFFIVPGVIAMCGLCFAPMYLVDANLGPIDALGASWVAKKGQKGRIFGFFWVSVLIAFLGLLALIVGVIPASLLLYIAWAAAFTRASGREPAMPDGMRP